MEVSSVDVGEVKVSVPKIKKRKKGLGGKLAPFIMIGPLLTWMLLLIVIPMAYVVYISFMTKGTYGGIVYQATVDNYSKLLNPLYFDVFINSLKIATATTVWCILLGYPFAYIITRAGNKAKVILMLMIIIPFWTNSLVRTYGWIILLRTEGIFNQVLIGLHLIKEPLKMLYNDFGVTVGMIYTLFPFMVLPLYSSIEKLDRSLIEAAKDLGAKPIKCFTRVILPLTSAGIFAGSILVFIPSLAYFFIADLMGGSKTLLVGNLVRNQFLTARNWPLGASLSIGLIAITLILLWLYTKVAKLDDMEVF